MMGHRRGRILDSRPTLRLRLRSSAFEGAARIGYNGGSSIAPRGKADHRGYEQIPNATT